MSEEGLIVPDAFDWVNTPKTPEAALQSKIEAAQQSKSEAAKSFISLKYERQSPKGLADDDHAHFFGKNPDGRVRAIVTFRKGGKSGSWIESGRSACSAIKPVGSAGTQPLPTPSNSAS
jgi:hypothetical protein